MSMTRYSFWQSFKKSVARIQSHLKFSKIINVINGVFRMSYCCYGNLLCDKNGNNVHTNDWAVFLIP